MTGLAIAVDIGGSGVRLALVSAEGLASPVAQRSLEAGVTPAELATVLGEVRAEIETAARTVSAIGVSFPALLETHGRVTTIQNLPGLAGIDVAQLMRAVFGLPAEVKTDGVCGAIAESRLGDGRGVSRFLSVLLGTGASATMLVDGAVVDTAFGVLGDAGHITVDPNGPECLCGGVGCLEALASGAAFARAGKPLGFASASEVIRQARAGHPRANEIANQAGVSLGRAIAIWASLLWPEIVTVGGGLMALGEPLLATARNEMRRVGLDDAVERIELIPGRLGSYGPLIGAGLVALQAMEPNREMGNPR